MSSCFFTLFVSKPPFTYTGRSSTDNTSPVLELPLLTPYPCRPTYGLSEPRCLGDLGVKCLRRMRRDHSRSWRVISGYSGSGRPYVTRTPWSWWVFKIDNVILEQSPGRNREETSGPDPSTYRCTRYRKGSSVPESEGYLFPDPVVRSRDRVLFMIPFPLLLGLIRHLFLLSVHTGVLVHVVILHLD